MTACFVTSTGTEIGKTFVVRGMIHRLRAQGRAVEALKPVVSGYDPQDARISDPGLLLAALGRPVTAEAVADISPWRFAAPLSPNLAARAEGRQIDFPALVDFCGKKIAARADALVIEGIGGIMVPLDDKHTVLDWIAALDMPIVLVAGSYLGTFSHALSAIAVLIGRNIRIASVVISETPGGPGLSDTVETIRAFNPGVATLALPRLAAGSWDHAVFAEMIDRL